MDNFNENNKIKINLPYNEESFINGSGEGVWAIVDDMTSTRLSETNDIFDFNAKLLNTSVYYNNLEYGAVIKAQSRGELRPVAIYNDLIKTYEVKLEDQINNLKSNIMALYAIKATIESLNINIEEYNNAMSILINRHDLLTLPSEMFADLLKDTIKLIK